MTKDARIAFYGAMKGKAYGHEPTRSAWDWFLQGWDIRPAHETKAERRLCLHYWGDYRKRCQRPEGHAGEHWYLAPASAISVDVEFGTMPPEEPKAPRDAEDALLEIERHSRRIEILCDYFKFDPAEFLAEGRAENGGDKHG